jgi:hypothetical protein
MEYLACYNNASDIKNICVLQISILIMLNLKISKIYRSYNDLSEIAHRAILKRNNTQRVTLGNEQM